MSKETLYFVAKINVAGKSPKTAKERIEVFKNQVRSNQKPEDQFEEKWVVLPIDEGQSSVELLYPTDTDNSVIDARLNEIACMQFRMPLSKDELKRRYLAVVDEICTDIDTKTGFEPGEICDLIYNIIKNAPVKAGNGWHPVFYCGIPLGTSEAIMSTEEARSCFDKFKVKASDKVLMGRMGYTSGPDILLNDVTHAVSDVLFEDGILWAKINPLDNVKGAELKELINAKEVVFRAGMSGEIVNEHGANYVKVYDVFSIDAVRNGDDPYQALKVYKENR